MVRVPAYAADVDPAVLGLFLVRDRRHIRAIGQIELFQMLSQGGAEQAGSAEECRRIQCLVPDGENRVFDEGLSQCVRRLRRNGARQIDPLDFGADMLGLLRNRKHNAAASLAD